MSMDRCTRCSDIVDTDDHPEFYDFSYITSKGCGGHCENCRDDIMENMTDAEQDEHERKIYGLE